MKKKISKKNAVIIAGAVVAVTAVGGTAYAMSGPKLALNKEKVTVEYVTKYKPELKDIVKDYKDFDKKSLKLINKIPNEKDKTYPAVGKYTITVKYKKNSLKQSVFVKDTKAPEVAVPADIEILQETDLATFDFKSLMNVSDASETTIDVDTSKVDVNTPAQYDINVTVTDKHGNKTVKAGRVTVTAKPEIGDDEQVVQETVKNSDGTTAVRNSVQKKSQSSGKKVVSNSSNVTRKSTASSQSASSNRTSTNSNKTSGGNRTSGSSSKGNSASENHSGSLTVQKDPNAYRQGDGFYSEGAEINGEDFDKLTGGDWKNWNY
ncbi:hypothetical protein [Catenibacterium sp.]|uniref:hypothetical protein n=1 Tax=Catenibacterium sp. TaxID=2049022 RepID=UPI002E781CE8|nr:hypothetical protein [Catenibacterium sp.]MEE0819803.1 hypothetical protein [Catenibacterium sp.]